MARRDEDFFDELRAALDAAAGLIWSAEALLIGAGAGMSVDSGLPDYRGEEGLARSLYAGLTYEAIADPRWLEGDPGLAWGFYGRRLEAYRAAEPHAGFSILRGWVEARDAFVYTSNVDNHFVRAGFDGERLVECHGSLEWLQCVERCSLDIWPAGELALEIGEDGRARPPWPLCRGCGGAGASERLDV